LGDYLVKGLALGGKVRVYAINSTQLVNHLQESHQTCATASAALGRTATIGSMMGAMLKGEEKLTIQVKGNGPIGQIIVDANSTGEVRGYVTNPVVNLPLNEKGKLDVAGAVGHGNIYVIKDLGLKEPYRGSVEIISGELAEDFTYYFLHSEQTPSAVAAGVLVNPDNSIKAAGGFIIQVMPGIVEDDLLLLEKSLEALPAVSSLIEQGLSPEQILKRLFNNEIQLLDKVAVTFKCTCSKERVKNILVNLGKEDIEDMIANEGKAEIACQFCRAKYTLNRRELEEIAGKL